MFMDWTKTGLISLSSIDDRFVNLWGVNERMSG